MDWWNNPPTRSDIAALLFGFFIVGPVLSAIILHFLK